MEQPWFNPNLFGTYFGVIAGGGFGILGGTLGTLAGILGPRGKGRRLVLGAMAALVGLSVVSFGFGLVALLFGQPYGIWFGPLLLGIILGVVEGTLIQVVRRRYDEAEQRRLEAEGIRGS